MTKNSNDKTRMLAPLAWVLFAIFVGLLASILAIFLTPHILSLRAGRPGPAGPVNNFTFSTYAALGTTLSGISFTLLTALLIVYIRIYWETRARHALGLTLFLAALLVEPALTLPVFFITFGPPMATIGILLILGRSFLCAALAIFLYVSLQ